MEFWKCTFYCRLIQASWMCYNSACIDTCVDYVPALEGRAVINLQMGNLFGSFLDISSAIKVVCACVCVYYVHTYVCMYRCVYVYMYVYMYMCARMYVRTCVHACVCIYVYQRVYIIA